VAAGPAGTIHINDILINNTGAPITATYTVTPSVGICAGLPADILITVKPSPVLVLNQAKSICSGDRVDYEILLAPGNTPAGTTFSWPDPDGSGSATSKLDIPADPAGTLHIQDTLYNGTAAPIQVVYRVIPRGTNGCNGVIRDVTITVNPGAIADAGSAQTMCANGTITLTGASIGGLATQGTWSIVSGPAGGVITNGTNTTTPAAATFSASAGGTYKLRLTTDDPAGACNPVFDDVIITVKNPGDPSCTGGTGTCSTVSIVPVPTPATCNNSDGSVFFNINPPVPIIGDVKITIDGTGSTILPSPRTNFASVDGFTFDVLAVGTYSYSIEYGDATCTKVGTFSIDRSGTVGTPTATNPINPDCFGGTGTVTLDAPGQTGNSLQWSIDGITWTDFIAGSAVTGIPATATIIGVRRSTDACAGSVAVSFTEPKDLAATFIATDATCNNNDGSIRITHLKGGTPGYIVQLNGTVVNMPSDSTFKGLTAGSYTVVITDSKSCAKTFNPVTVSFPGFVNTTAPVISAPDCNGGGTNGKVTLTITDPGSFEFAFTNDLVVEPTGSYNPLGGSLVSVSNLSQGDYALWLRPTGAGVKCATKIDVTISGIYTVSYTASTSDVICFSQPTSVVVDNIKGAPGLPFTYTLTNTGDNSVTSGSISASQALSAYSVTGVDRGQYSLMITQDQSSLVPVCTTPIGGSAISLVVDGPTAALGITSIDSTKSVPDMPSGTAFVIVQPSGLDPYETRLELLEPAVPGQTYASDWSEVNFSTDSLKFQRLYTNLYAGLYSVSVRDASGCEKDYTFSLGVNTDLLIPNIFTPNGDGHNEVFFIRNLPDESKLLISNRWGNEVYKTSSYQNDWGGGTTPDGTYFYTLTIGSQKYTGWIEILRGQ
jgi:gliding motility-associated-like protein